MSFRLLGSDFPFPSLFQQQLHRLMESLKQLNQLLQSPSSGHPSALKIRELEAESRKAFHHIHLELALIRIRPQENQDLRELNLALDGLHRALGNLAARAALPPPLPRRESACLLTALLVDLGGQLPDMLTRLQRGESLEGLWGHIRLGEAEAAKTLTVALGEVFEAPEGSALEAMRWVHLFDRIQDILAGLEKTAWIILGMALRRD